MTGISSRVPIMDRNYCLWFNCRDSAHVKVFPLYTQALSFASQSSLLTQPPRPTNFNRSRERLRICFMGKIKCIKIEKISCKDILAAIKHWPVHRAFCAICFPPLACRRPLPLQVLKQTVKQRNCVPAFTLVTELANTSTWVHFVELQALSFYRWQVGDTAGDVMNQAGILH